MMMRFYACGITVIVVIALAGIGSQLRLIGRLPVDDGHPVQLNDTIGTAPDGNSSSVTKQQMIIALANVRRQCIDSIRAKHKEFYASSIIPKKHTTVLLVDPAYHGNVGDNMLSRGEQAFLSAFNKTNNMEECMYIQAGKRAPPCSAVLSRTNATLALWHAGGNWGDLYMSVHSKRMNSFVELLDHGMTIISMPQSLYYRNASLHREHANLMRRNIMKGLRLKDTTSPKNRRLIKSKVMFTWREQGSFDQAKRLYPFATNKLIPDIAFQIGPFQPIPPKNDTNKVDILVFLRADKESKFGGNGRSPGNIQRILNQIGKNVTFAVVDWIDRLKIFGTKNILFDETSIELLSLGKVVICDRLHAAILAYLSNLPVVYLDQESNKLTNVLNVAFSSSDICKDKRNMVIKSLSLQDSLEKAIEILATDGAGHGNVLKVAV